MEWDDQITRDLVPELFELLDERNDLQTVEIPRYYFGYCYDNIALHFFSDASYSALATVAHFVYSNSGTRRISSAFVLGKARAAPLKQHTITKFVIQAAILLLASQSSFAKNRGLSSALRIPGPTAQQRFSGYRDLRNDNNFLFLTELQKFWKAPKRVYGNIAQDP